jgi:hypothetical protein
MTLTLGIDTEKSESFLEPTKYRIKYQCELCGHNYARTFKAIPIKDPPCPSKSCAAQQELASLKQQMANLQKMVLEQQAPGQVGNKVVVKAVDETAKIVMEDYKMTDLKDNIRHGESVAPKLPGQQQALADNYFGGGGLRAAGISSKQADALGRRAIAGAFRSTSLNPGAIQLPDVKNGQSPLRVMRTEPTGKK